MERRGGDEGMERGVRKENLVATLNSSPPVYATAPRLSSTFDRLFTYLRFTLSLTSLGPITLQVCHPFFLFKNIY